MLYAKNTETPPYAIAALSLAGILISFFSLLPSPSYAYTSLITWLHTHTGSITPYIIEITNAGSVTAVSIAVGIIVLGLLSRKNHTQKEERKAHIIILAGILAISFIFLFKGISDIPRPSSSIIEETSSRFPSGHAGMSLYLALSLFLVFHDRFKKPISRVLLSILLLLYPLAIGFSRIYLNVHTPTDIIAGFLTTVLAYTLTLIFLKDQKR